MKRDVQAPPLSPSAWLRWDAVCLMLPDTPTDVLEVGCGQGGFGSRLASRFEYVGVEPDLRSCEVARRRIEPLGGHVHHGDRTVLGGNRTFGMVVSFEVLEHIEDDRQEVAEWLRLLRPGGRLVMSVPAWSHRFGSADRLVGHYRRYDPPALRALLEDAGFIDVQTAHYGMPLGYSLEVGRNVVSWLRLRSQKVVETETGAQMSGRYLQPARRSVAVISELATAPFRRIQRRYPQWGPGLLATATAPAQVAER